MNWKKFILSVGLVSIITLLAFAQDFETLQSKADQDFMDGKIEEALSQYKILMQTTDGDSVQRSLVYSYAALCAEQLNQNTDALKFYKEAVLLQVPRLMIYDKMISLAKQEKDYDNYEFALLKKLHAFSDFEYSIVESLGYNYYNTQQYEKLLPISTKLNEWYPDNAKFHYFGALAKQNLNDFDGAEKGFKRVLELEPDHAGANMGMGMILYNRASKMYDKLKADYEAKAKPDRIDYSNYRKNLEEPKAIYNEALTYLLKAYQNKSYASLGGVIRNIYLRLGEKEKAAKY